LRDAVPERPVFLLRFDQADEHIFHTHAKLFVEPRGNGFVQRLLQFDAAAFADGELDDDDTVGPGNAQILGIVDQAIFVVFSDDLEVVFRRHVDGIRHAAINHFTDAFAETGGFAFSDCNADQWHDFSFSLR
jgi:hypothetical protein